MQRIMDLLEKKNHFLEKFYFINETEIQNFKIGIFTNIEYFYQQREGILGAIKYIDNEIDKLAIDAENIKDEKLAAEVRAHLEIKNKYVNLILTQDLEILSCVENEKSEIIKELQDIRKNKKAVGGYKSRTFKNNLDEEA